VIQACMPQVVNTTPIASHQPHTKPTLHLSYMSNCLITVCRHLSCPISAVTTLFPRFLIPSVCRISTPSEDWHSRDTYWCELPCLPHSTEHYPTLRQAVVSRGDTISIITLSCLERGHKDKEQSVDPEPPRTPVREVWTPSSTPHFAAPEFTPVTARLRQSKRIGKVPVQEGNIYGKSQHPVKQFQDIQ
jgi:hypothetical protein